jgi:hypothetical protein
LRDALGREVSIWPADCWPAVFPGQELLTPSNAAVSEKYAFYGCGGIFWEIGGSFAEVMFS